MSNDVDFCNGIGCGIRNRCLRYIFGKKAKANHLYWWVDPKYSNGKCELFLKKREG